MPVVEAELGLTKVDNTGKTEDRYPDDMEQETKFFVSLFESVEQGSESSEMTEQFVHTKYFQYLHEPDHFPRPADQTVILQPLKDQGNVKGK